MGAPPVTRPVKRARDPARGLVRICRFEGSVWCEIRTGPGVTDWDGIPDRPKDQREVIRACIRYAVQNSRSCGGRRGR